MNGKSLLLLEQAITEQASAESRSAILSGGYNAFYELLEELKDRIKRFEDDEAEEVLSLIERGKNVIPDPVALSPSWDRIWYKLEQTALHKIRVLRAFPEGEREGEWQIVLDNPHAIQEVVCYPGLSFLEAAYLFGYFRPDLEKNEYIRLQKVVSLMAETGD